MLKIFTTQLSGVFRQIVEKNEAVLEDSARLLAQTILSGGNIYIYGEKGMSAVALEATEGKNALPNAERWCADLKSCPAQSVDAVIYCGNIFSNEDAQEKLRRMHERETAIIIITDGACPEGNFSEATDLLLSTGEQYPLVPKDNGEKIGYPNALSLLYLYHALYLNVMDILDEY